MKKGLLFFLLMNALFIYGKKNVILIIADDLGTDYCGFYDGFKDTAALPNLRRLVANGVVFNNAMSNPVCSPTRAGILTGRYSFRTGVGDAVGGAGSAALDTSEMTIPRLLKIYNAQIRTANIGKWHLSQTTPASNLNIPNLIGYDHYAGNFLGALTSYYNWSKVTNGVMGTSTTYATTETVDDAIDWINQNKQQPFFLWLAFNAPHTPLHLPPTDLHAYSGLSGTPADINAQPKTYFKASLEALDHEIGRLLDSLIAFNEIDSTNIIFIADNGNGIRSSQIDDTLKAKGSIYQYGVHVPFVISGPTVVQKNRKSDALVNVHDLFPTILEIMGDQQWKDNIPISTTIDGVSLIPILNNSQTSVREWTFTEIFKATPDASDGKAIRNSTYKLLDFDLGNQEFYNLSLDPEENDNILERTLNAIEIQEYQILCAQMNELLGSTDFCKSTVGLELNESNVVLSAFPNPSKNVFTIKVPKAFIGETLLISDILSNIKFYTPISEELMQITLFNQPSGIYYVSILAPSMNHKPIAIIKE